MPASKALHRALCGYRPPCTSQPDLSFATTDPNALSSLALAGAVGLAVGATVYFGFDYVLAVVPH